MLRHKIGRFFKNLLIIELAGILITYLVNQNIHVLLKHWAYIMSYSGILGLSLWYGNGWIAVNIKKVKFFSDKPEKLFLVSATCTFFYSILAVYLMDFAWNTVYMGQTISEYKLPPVSYFLIVMSVTLVISFSLYIKSFIQDKKAALIQEEKLKNEILKLEYETLKNQVNPHFLFNSLNALTSLVAENEDAVRFIKNLSDVYRYVLEQKDKELVELERELHFVSSYLYLHRIRFGENLQIDICKAPLNKKVVPLAVQMLVENAIKHNEISSDVPLIISIYIDNEYLIIENNLQLKSSVNSYSGIGLDNIQSRYAYLTEKKISAGKVENKFIVKLPLLSLENY